MLRCRCGRVSNKESAFRSHQKSCVISHKTQEAHLLLNDSEKAPYADRLRVMDCLAGMQQISKKDKGVCGVVVIIQNTNGDVQVHKGGSLKVRAVARVMAQQVAEFREAADWLDEVLDA